MIIKKLKYFIYYWIPTNIFKKNIKISLDEEVIKNINELFKDNLLEINHTFCRFSGDEVSYFKLILNYISIYNSYFSIGQNNIISVKEMEDCINDVYSHFPNNMFIEKYINIETYYKCIQGYICEVIYNRLYSKIHNRFENIVNIHYL